MKLKKVLLTSCIAIGILSLVSCAPKLNQIPNQTQQRVSYPQKTIKVINMLAANIPPDISTRKIAAMISDKYGWKFEFENDPSQKGVTAMNKVWDIPHDGYTILAHTEVIVSPAIYGITKHSTKDWKFFIAERIDTAFCVRTNLKIIDFQDFIKYAKANPGKVRVGVNISDNQFHLKAIALEKVTGIKLNIKTYPTSKEQLQDFQNGKLDAVLNPLQVTSPLIRKGVVKPLVMMDAEAYNYGSISGNIESIVKTYPEYKKYLPLDAVISFAMPKDVPQDVSDAFGNAFKDVMATGEATELARKSDASILNITGVEASEYMGKIETNFYKLAKELGLAKVNPATLDVSK